MTDDDKKKWVDWKKKKRFDNSYGHNKILAQQVYKLILEMPKLNKEDKEYFYQSIEGYLFDLVDFKVRKDNA